MTNGHLGQLLQAFTGLWVILFLVVAVAGSYQVSAGGLIKVVKGLLKKSPAVLAYPTTWRKKISLVYEK